MAVENQRTRETERLQAIAAQSRLQAIQSQLALGFTLCTLAETQIRIGQFAEARRIVDKVEQSAETIRFHIDEPNHVPKDSIEDLHKHLTQLEIRVGQIGVSLIRHD